MYSPIVYLPQHFFLPLFFILLASPGSYVTKHHTDKLIECSTEASKKSFVSWEDTHLISVPQTAEDSKWLQTNFVIYVVLAQLHWECMKMKSPNGQHEKQE